MDIKVVAGELRVIWFIVKGKYVVSYCWQLDCLFISHIIVITELFLSG